MKEQYDDFFEKANQESYTLLEFLYNKKVDVVSYDVNQENETVKIKFKNNDDIVQVIHNGDEINICLNQKEDEKIRALTLDGAIQVLERSINEPIEELGFTPRTYNLLKRGGVNNKFELKNMTFQEIAKIRNMSTKAVKEIESKLNIEFE